MGCKESYCNKRDLCLLMREIWPDSCYKLPEDLERWKTQTGQNKLWVLKQDVSPSLGVFRFGV